MADGEQGLEIAPAASLLRVAIQSEGGEQFVVIPDAFRFAGDEVSIRMENGSIILTPVPASASPQTDAEWAAFWSGLDALRGESRLVLASDDAAPDADR